MPPYDFLINGQTTFFRLLFSQRSGQSLTVDRSFRDEDSYAELRRTRQHLSSGGGHRSLVRIWPPAVEAHVQFDDSSGEQIGGFLNSKSPLVLDAPHKYFKGTSNRLRRLLARPPVQTDWTLVYPLSPIFPNSEISPGRASYSSDLDEALELGLALPIVLASWTRMANKRSRASPGEMEGYEPLWKSAGASIEVWSWSKAGPRGQRKTWQLRREAL